MQECGRRRPRFSILDAFALQGPVRHPAHAVQQGLQIAPKVMAFDLWVMIAVSLACMPVFLSRRIGRRSGAFFLACYVAYMAHLVLAAQKSSVLGSFDGWMTGIVLPVCVLVLVIVVVRSPFGHSSEPGVG